VARSRSAFLAVWWIALAARRHSHHVSLEERVTTAKEIGGFVPWGYGPMVGVGEIEFPDPIESRERKIARLGQPLDLSSAHPSGRPMSEEARAETLRRVAERSRWRYALLHPLGKRYGGI
jgi:hypothetical protein